MKTITMPKFIAYSIARGATSLCAHKVGYDTFALAMAASKRRRKHEGRLLWAYKCQHERCPYYHLSKKNPNAKP